MTAPHITPLPTPPSRSQSPDTFSTDADAFLGALPDFQSDANAQADYLDGLADQVTVDAAAAEAAAAIAAGAANYMGDYNALTTYQIGESVSYNGRRYVAKTVNTGVTPADGANWFLINDGDVLGPLSATNNSIALFDGTTGKILKSGLDNGTAGQALLSGGAGNVPTWGSVEGGILPFTASGSILDGKPLALRSDGKVEQVTGFTQTETLGAAANYTSSSSQPKATFDIPGTSNFIVFHKTNTTQQVVIGSISGNTISYGTPVTAPWNGITDPPQISCAYDPISGKFFVAWLQTSGTYPDTFGAVLTVTGTTPSWGAAAAVYDSDTSFNTSGHAVIYDILRQKIVVCSSGGNVNSGQQQIWLHSINISGTSFTVGYRNGPFVLSTGGFTSLNAAYDVAAQRIIVSTGNIATNNSLFLFSNSGSAFSYVATGTLTFNVGWGGLTYDIFNQQYIAVGRDASGNLASCAFTVSASSFTVGSTLTAALGATTLANNYFTPATYDARSRQIFVAGYTQLNEVYYGLLSASGTTLSVSKAFGTIGGSTRQPTCIYNATTEKTVLGYYSDGASAGVNRIFIPAVTITNAYNFIGVSNAAASNGQSVPVVVGGGRTSKLTGLTANIPYYVTVDGNVATSGLARLGVATSATSLLVEPKIATAGSPSASTYLRGDGAWASVQQAMTLIASGTLASAASQVLVNNLSLTGYSSLIIEMSNICPDGNIGSVWFALVAPGGTTDSGSFNSATMFNTNASTTPSGASRTGSAIQINIANFDASYSLLETHFAIRELNSSYKPIEWRGLGAITWGTGTSQNQIGGGYHNISDIGGFRLFPSSGNLKAGLRYRVYGVI